VISGGQIGDQRPAIGEFNPIEGTLAEYEMGSDLTGIFVNPPVGQAVHYAGLIGATVLTGSLWASRQDAVDFFAATAVEGLTEFVHRLMAPHRDPDLSYQLRPAEAVVIGPAAVDFELRPRGKADGAVLVRTSGAALPPADSSGLVAAARLGAEDHDMLYEFRDAAPPEPSEDAEVIQLYSLFTAAPSIARLAQG
jgi:hypothetical protein